MASQCSSNAHADSTFDFGTDSEGSDHEQSVDISTGDHHERFEADMREDRSTEESMDFNMFDCSSSDGEEIWELSDSESGDESVADSNETVQQILFGLTFFLSRKCLFVEFPNHPLRSHRSKCGAVLMKQVRLQGKPKFIPKKTYIYHSVIKALVDLAKRPDF